MFKSSIALFLAASATVGHADPKPEPIKTIVLVHGAFADSSSWDKVAPILEAKGYRLIAVNLPLDSFANDVAATKRALEVAPGPVLLVGHSYGGFVITEAGTNEKVKGLVYVAAFAPDNGESVNDIYKGRPQPEWIKGAIFDTTGFAWLKRETVATTFAQDLSQTEITNLTRKQGPTALALFEGRITNAAWHTKPAWFVRPENDRMVAPDIQADLAKRAGMKVTNIKSSHVVMLSHPNEVATVILAAAANK